MRKRNRQKFITLLKNKALKSVFLFFFLLCLNPTMSSAQSSNQKKLEAERTKLQKEIKKINSLLFETKKEQKSLLQQIEDLNRKIRIRAELINVVKKEARVLNNRIHANKKEINHLEAELTTLKKDYSAMIYKSYKSKSIKSRLMFLLSSENFNQAYKRLKYMNQYTDFRKKQGEKIAVQANKIKKLNSALTVQKIKKENLLATQKEAQTLIEVEKKDQEVLILTVKSQEKKYIAEIRQKQKEEEKIQAQIEKIIRDAIAASKKRNKSKSKGFALTPEAKMLASKFTQNKGKLPWPVTNALVIRDFGKIPHKTLKGITIQSNGIHIATNKNADARAIFDGKVLAIQVSSNGVKTVYVQHGNYISLYSNLETIKVQKGDKVLLEQPLGRIYNDKITGKTVLKFQIWKDTEKENPKKWLLKL
ncbi:MAG: murein hydrolase activator EnvC family protein [Flavicella sp.]